MYVATRLLIASLALIALVACIPEPPQIMLPTLPAVLDITPAPPLDIDATATALSSVVLPSPTAAALYTVQPGDTLSDLAAHFATTVEELVAANGLTDPNDLQPGQSLIIPSLLPTPAPASANPDTTPTPTLATP
ncbi:LysM peptidoglycan-binding domain-containing protein [Candidatus Viridilinea mediisalina]|uniref:LysM peptidoglycan-binding domain-containing protein n=1 Tax=Candidatus Viridilinea mediisalina TaxID=2024553 RepID=UPI001FE39BBF|nr:LysM domain-containing protein [Candidatus Viridilinea mediisalina]